MSEEKRIVIEPSGAIGRIIALGLKFLLEEKERDKKKLLKLDSYDRSELRTHLRLKWHHYHPIPPNWSARSWRFKLENELWELIREEV